MENYKNQRLVMSKRLYNGGCVFIKWNEATKKYYLGNTASTAVSAEGMVDVYGVTVKEVKSVERGLKNAGFTAHEVRWNQPTDTYDDIKKAGL